MSDRKTIAGKILVAVDGSENSKRAAELAVRIAKTNNSELILLSVIATPVYLVPMAPGPSAPIVDFNTYYDTAETNAQKWMDSIAGPAEHDNVKTGRLIVRSVSSIVDSIVSTAEKENVDLIVIGTRGLGGFKRLLVGSVSGGVVEHAHCNVLVVR